LRRDRDDEAPLGAQRSKFYILKASREKHILAELELDSQVSATAVAANGVLYVTTRRNLYAIQHKEIQ